MGKRTFCERFIHLTRRPISFSGRPYLTKVYASKARNLVLRCSRQTEKTTFITNTLVFEACAHPGINILFVSPRRDQARVFSHTRLIPTLEHSPVVRRLLWGCTRRRPSVFDLIFRNESQLFVRAAFHSGDAIRGISADLLLIDEFQDIAAGDLPVLQETLSHSRCGRTVITGTPKLVENHIEGIFALSTANEWTILCTGCGRGVILDERCLGPTQAECPNCRQPLRVANGSWVPRNPEAQVWDGYWVNHLMVPWLNYDAILERQRTYDAAKFQNEVLGLPTALGDHVVTRAELEACCSSSPMAQSLADVPASGRQTLVAGIDWGGGGTSRTAVAIGFMRSDYKFQVCRFERLAPQEDPSHVLDAVVRSCLRFRVAFIAADGGGNGHVYNRLLLDRLNRRSGLFAILYSDSHQPPRRDGALVKWSVNRSATIGTLFSRVKKKSIIFPRAEDCGSFLDEFACEIAEYDDLNRTVRYSHRDGQLDDALHATNYAHMLSVHVRDASRPGMERYR
jgi:Phage terminase large subunit (GpA)